MGFCPHPNKGRAATVGVANWAGNGQEIDLSSPFGIIEDMIAAMKNDRGRKMLSCSDAAKEYGCSMRYIRRLVELKRISHEVVAGSYFVPADELAALKAQVARGTGRHKPKEKRFSKG